MKFSIHSQTFSTQPNEYLFNATRKFFRRAGVDYTADMKQHAIFVNNGTNSAFSLHFDSYNYVRVRKIPSGSLEFLFQANSPEWILKKLFDYRIVHLSEVGQMMKLFMEEPLEKIDHNPKGLMDS